VGVQFSTMDLLQLVKQERDRLNKVIALLEHGAPTSNSPTAQRTGASTSNAAPRKHKRHEWTAEERKAMSLKQKALWAKKQKENEEVAEKPKQAMSAATRRKLAAAQRARWARVRAQQKKAA
jgi:hypothetical protein